MENIEPIRSKSKSVRKRKYKIVSYNPYNKIVVYETAKGLIQTNDTETLTIKNGYVVV
jgi:hypothetical protein